MVVFTTRPRGMRLVTFLDNHDQPRFLSREQADNDWQRLKSALVFLYTGRGIPCLYYGTEQAFNGGADPADREDMFAGQFKDGPRGVDSFNMTHPLFQWVARLNNFRRLYPLASARHCGASAASSAMTNGPGLFAYARRWDGAMRLPSSSTPRPKRGRCPPVRPSARQRRP
jgi:glycosidase